MQFCVAKTVAWTAIWRKSLSAIWRKLPDQLCPMTKLSLAAVTISLVTISN
jgi:hypothetical protein